MKTRMKKDLIQGLLTYPAPVSKGGTKTINKKKSVNGKFFQMISPQGVITGRLSRRKLNQIEPVIIKPDNREVIWLNLRKNKNI